MVGNLFMGSIQLIHMTVIEMLTQMEFYTTQSLVRELIGAGLIWMNSDLSLTLKMVLMELIQEILTQMEMD